MTADDVGKLERFKDYVLTLSDAESGDDDPTDCLSTLFGLPSGYHKGTRTFTVGQVIARARETNGSEFREFLQAMGMRLERQRSQVTGRLESHEEAWLAIANKLPALEKLFEDYPQYQHPKRAQILADLSRHVNGEQHQAKPIGKPLKFAGPSSRACWCRRSSCRRWRKRTTRQPRPSRSNDRPPPHPAFRQRSGPCSGKRSGLRPA
jgi:hypothetical protein